jgi:hypothetical protein
MIRWLRDNPTGVLFTINEREADRLRAAYPGLADRIQRIEEGASLGRRRRRPIAIDNLDLWLNDFLGGRVEIVSVDGNDDETSEG